MGSVVFSTVSYIQQFDCRFIPKNETENVIITPSCLEGTIDWNYPRGSLKVLFNQPKPYSLCLTDWIGGGSFTIYDNSFGKMTHLKMLSSGNEGNLYPF